MVIRGAQAIRVIGNTPVSRAATSVTRGRLRVLAHHGVPDPGAFERQLAEIAAQYRPVTGRDVVAAYRQGRPLPPRAVWVTFDDGHPEVVTDAMERLERWGIRATMFVCPAVIDTNEPFWWEVVRAAERLGVPPPPGAAGHRGPLEAALKACPDARRRQVVAELGSAIESRDPEALYRPQLSSQQLRQWLEHGHEVGNHTWDHPLLDTCTPEQQRGQIRRAHQWLERATGSPPTLFAYPNGNWSAASEQELNALDYQLGVGFDHRLARAPQEHRLRVSRLRVDTDAPVDRFRAIISGVHPRLLTTRRQLLERDAARKDPRMMPR